MKIKKELKELMKCHDLAIEYTGIVYIVTDNRQQIITENNITQQGVINCLRHWILYKELA